MTIRKIPSGQVHTTLENYVGELGHLFYDSNRGNLRLSDGHTPGGISLLSSGTGNIIQSSTPPAHNTGTLWYDTVGGRSYVYFDNTWVDAAPISGNGPSWLLTSSTAVVSLTSTGQFNLGTAQNQAGSFTDVAVQIDSDTNSYAQIVFQNHNSGPIASTDIVLMNSDGDDFNNIIDIGINSNNYDFPEYSIQSPGSGYLFTNGGDLTIGTQTPGKALIFHAGGTTGTNSVGRFDQYGWAFNRQVVVSDNKTGPLVFTTQNISTSSNASALYQAENDNNSYLQFGILGSHNGGIGVDWNPSDVFFTANGSGQSMHFGGQLDLRFYASRADSNTSDPALWINNVDQTAVFDGNILPQETASYNLGTSTAVWNTLYVNHIAYTPSTPSNWHGTPPTTVQQALDRLAAVVKSLNGGIGA
jgi:hypothetical protein